MTESPAHSMCGSTGERPFSDANEHTTHALRNEVVRLKRENTKLQRKVEILKEKSSGTEKLVRLHKDLKEQYQKLQREVSSQGDAEIRQKFTEAQKTAQEELERRCALQQKLSEALGRCQKEQETNLGFLRTRAQEQNELIELRNEVQTLKERLKRAETLVERSDIQSQKWKEFQNALLALIQKTGIPPHSVATSRTGLSVGVDLLGLPDGSSELVAARRCTEAKGTGNGNQRLSGMTTSPHCTSDSSCFPIKPGNTPPPIKRGKKGREKPSSHDEKKRKRRTPTNEKTSDHTYTPVSQHDMDCRKEPSAQVQTVMQKGVIGTPEDLVQLIQSCGDGSDLEHILQRAVQSLEMKAFTVEALRKMLCEIVVSSASETPILDTHDGAEELDFLIPWCTAHSSQHQQFCMTMTLALSLDSKLKPETENEGFLMSLLQDLHHMLQDQITQHQILKSSAITAAIGHLTKASQLNQFFSVVLMDVLLAESPILSVVLVHVLLFSWPSFFEASLKNGISAHSAGDCFQVKTVFSCIAQVCTSCLSLHDMAQLCSTRIAAYGQKHHWWSDLHSAPTSLLRSGQMAVPEDLAMFSIKLGQTSIEAANDALSHLHNALMKGDTLTPAGWTEWDYILRLMFCHHAASLVYKVWEEKLCVWVLEASSSVIYRYGQLLGQILAFLLRRWREGPQRVCQVMEWVFRCVEAFEQRIRGELFAGTPQKFLTELLTPIQPQLPPPTASTEPYLSRLASLWSQYRLSTSFPKNSSL